MRKWLIAGTVLIFLCVIIVIALLNLNTLIDRNRDKIIAQAEQALGRKVKVGEIGVSLWPGVGVRLNDFALSDDASFSKTDFVRAKNLQINLELWPLLHRQIEIKRLILNQPKIDIIRDTRGTFNFSTIGVKEGGKKPGAATSATGGTTPLALLVNLIDVSGGDLHYLDRKEGIDLAVRQIDVKVTDFDPNKPFNVSLDAAVFSGKQNFKAQTQLGPIRAGADPNTIPLDGQFDLGPVNVDQLKSALPAIRAALPKELDLAGVFRLKNMRVRGTLNKLAINGTLEGTDATVNYGHTFKKGSGVPLALSVDAQYGADQLSLKQSDFKLNNLEVSAKGDLSLGQAPAVNLALNSKRFSLEGWNEIVPMVKSYALSGSAEVRANIQGRLAKGRQPEVQGTLTLSGVNVQPPQLPQGLKELNATVNLTPQTADIKEATFKLGTSPVKLAAEVKRFVPMVVSYKLSSPQFRASDVLSPAPEGLQGDTARDLNSEGLISIKDGNLTYQGKVTSAAGILYNIGYKNLGAGLVLDNGVAKIRDFSVEILKGSVRAQGIYSMSPTAPSFSLDTMTKGLDIKELYASVAPKAQRDLQGSLNANLKIAGKGRSWGEIKPSLSGQGQAEVIKGALLNFNLAEGVISGITGIGGLTSLINPQVREKYPETFKSKDTEFKELKGLFSLGKGQMDIKSLVITAADYTVQGNGRADFDHKVDFLANLILSKKLSDDLAHAAKELRYVFNSQGEFDIPFALTGTLPNVRPRPDSKYVSQLIQRGLANKGAEEIRRRLFGEKESKQPEGTETTPKKPDAVEDLIRRGLEGIFGR